MFELNKIYLGNCLDHMKQWPDECIDCCITSPPYYGLRDYGTAIWDGGDDGCNHTYHVTSPYNKDFNERYGNASGQKKQESQRHDVEYKNECKKCGAQRIDSQIGLEETPELYIQKLAEVFTEVKRVLKKDGTLWLNIGDSYFGGGRGNISTNKTNNKHLSIESSKPKWNFTGYKPKDLIGIPWKLAEALRGPWYSGKIKNEADRIWLAAMIDGEGCMFIHKRKSGTNNHSKYTKKDGSISEYSRKNDTYGAGLEIANTHKNIIERCLKITGRGSICCVERETKLKNRNIPLYRWNLRSNECRDVIKEIYPYLVGKKHEARLVLNCPSTGIEAEKCHSGLMLLHNGKICYIDYAEPKLDLWEPGFYLRQDIIWHKLNPMPESVTDRCTKAHEYIFLLSKSAKYYYDAEAIKVDALNPSDDIRRLQHQSDNNKSAPSEIKNGLRVRTKSTFGNRDGALNLLHSGKEYFETGKANKRSVWTVPTMPYSEAHFATFPEKLIEPCILTTRLDAVIYDPFGGAGTTGIVALRAGRKFILSELNEDYVDLANKRLKPYLQQMKLF